MMIGTSNLKRCFIDLETYSDVDLTECGVYAYSASPAFEILLNGYAVNDDDVTQESLVEGDKMSQEFIDMLLDPNIIKVAHNATFERVCLSVYLRKLGIIKGYLDPYHWECTANRAAELGMPRSLAGAGEALGLPPEEAKMASVGKQLIRYFCMPCKPTKVNKGRTRNLPHHDIEKWNLFKEYHKRDVTSERIIYYKECDYESTRENEHRLYELDQRINDAGVAIDMKLVDNILEYSDKYKAQLTLRQMEITHLENPNSLEQLKAWLQSREIYVDSITKENLDDIIKQATKEKKFDVVEVLEIRRETGKTSVTKYEAMKRAAVWDEETKSYRVHGMLMFYGAMRTGRWAGRIVQLQNLPKNKYSTLDFARKLVMDKDFEYLELLYGNVMDVFSQLIRTAFIPTKGNKFIVADYNAIEARVVAWLADEQWKVDMFKRGGKVYEETASRMFHIPVDQIGHDSIERAKGKVAELAGGYGGGVAAYKAMGADKFGWSDSEIQSLVYQWRDANQSIVKYWRTMERNAVEAYKNPGVVTKLPHRVAFRLYKDTLFMHLPCGRSLAMKGFEYGPYKDETRDTMTYLGDDPKTSRYVRLKSFGGKLVENLVQATARDCLGYAMQALSEKGFQIRFHVHDEVIIEVPESQADILEKQVTDVMALEGLNWKEGLPLRAESYQCDYYLKQ